ncbi:hypothetical protein ACF0H5_023007 [Mactra antiquata]
MYMIIEIFKTLGYLFYCIGEGFVRIFVPVRKKSFAGKNVLITGAGHGIGRELALKFNSVGARLILWDINKDNVERVAKEVNALGGNASSYVCDVTKIELIKSTAEKIARDVGDVEILVNNAGVLNGRALLNLTENEIRKTFDVNIFAYLWMCRQFLPSMIKRNEGHIINIASASAIRGAAYLTDYAATKGAVKCFTEALADEMYREGHSGIQFTCVFPMFVSTGLAKNMHDRAGRIYSPKEVALAVVEGAQMNKSCVFIPSKLDWSVAIGGLFPRRFIEEPTDLMFKGIDPQD